MKLEIETLGELMKSENESRKIEIESLDHFVTLKYPEKVYSEKVLFFWCISPVLDPLFYQS